MNVGIGLSVSNFSSVPTVGLDLDAAIAALFSSGEEGAWYDPSDLTTLYQDAAGTTPVTGTGQPVGLMLDKSKGGLSATELVDAFTLGTGWTYAGGVLSCDGSTSNQSATETTNATSGQYYLVTFDVNHVSGLMQVRTGDTFLATIGSSGIRTYIIKAAAASSIIRFTATTPAFTGTIDNISVRELPGNHATQSTSTARPTLAVTGTTPATLGSELVTNGTFDTSSDWTLGTGWTISGGVAAFAPGTGSLLSQSGTFASSRTYAISFDISLNGSCSMTVQFSGGGGSDTAGLLSFGSGSHTVFVSTTIARSVIGFSATAVSDFTIDNVSVKEVLTWADPKYYLDFDGVDDWMTMTYPSVLATPHGTAIAFDQDASGGGNRYIIDGATSPTERNYVSSNLASPNTFAVNGLVVNAVTFDPHVMVYNTNGASSDISVDGVYSSPVNMTASTGTSGINICMAYTYGSYQSVMKLYGLLNIDRVLTTAEIEATETYLADKSGVTLP